MAYCSASVATWGNPIVYQIQTMTNTPSDLGTCQLIVMQGSEYTAALQLAALTGGGSGGTGGTGTGTIAPQEPFDYQLAGQFWAFGFTVLISLYLISHVIGLVLKMVRDN